MALLCTSLQLAWAGSAFAVELTVTDTQASITGLSPQASASLISVRLTSDEGVRLTAAEDTILNDADGDGQIQQALSGDPTPYGLWLVADLAANELDVALPAEQPLLELASSAVELQVLAVGDELKLALETAHVWWVRSGMGVWSLIAVDGGEADLDTVQQGQIVLQLGLFQGVASSPAAPSSALAGDWFIVVDPETLGFYTAKVEASSSSEAPLALRPVRWGGR